MQSPPGLSSNVLQAAEGAVGGWKYSVRCTSHPSDSETNIPFFPPLFLCCFTDILEHVFDFFPLLETAQLRSGFI